MGDHGYYDENWNEITQHGRDVYGGREEMSEDYNTVHHQNFSSALSKVTLEKALRESQRAQAKVEKLLKAIQRFPEEFEIGTVLKFKHTFVRKVYNAYDLPPKAYDYVALRADNGFWYLTCSGSKTMNWEQLVEFIGDEPVTVMIENAAV